MRQKYKKILRKAGFELGSLLLPFQTRALRHVCLSMGPTESQTKNKQSLKFPILDTETEHSII